MKKKIIIVAILLFNIIFLFGCKKNLSPTSRTGLFFDTVITITLYDSQSTKKTEQLLQKSFDLCHYYESLFSKTLDGSDIYNINHSNGKPVTVSDETIFLLEKALFYSKQSNGLVDPSIEPLGSLWNFTSENPTVPSNELILEAKNKVNYEKIEIYENTVTLLDPTMSLDLGFIAKGFIADELKAFLLEEGITSGLINLGGNILAIGNKQGNSLFQIGIAKPFDHSNNPIVSIQIEDCSVVTSGIYQRYFEQDQSIYHHILNPKTGFPVTNDLLSVTIISKNSVDGDALSTYCLLLGLKEGLSYIETLPQIEAIFITSDYNIYYSSNSSNFHPLENKDL